VEEIRFAARDAAVDMPIVTAGLPPGFDVDGAELERLVKSGAVQKVQRTPRELIFYLTRLEAGQAQAITLHLRSRFPAQVQVPPPTVYEYYRPERKAIGAPVIVTVTG
jgi:alpha-2-macroglobulin-like protein